jgi:hypothetical protein
MQQNIFRNCKAVPLLGLLFTLFLFGVQGCEKDDICVDGDTPLLIVKFYDSEEPETSKPVDNLRVIGLGQDTPVGTFADRSTLDSIAIPLRPEEGETTFILILDSEDADEDADSGNADTLRFTYATTGEFISRACGFVANYENLNAQLEPDPLNWIQNIEVINSSVQKQDTTHVSIFH